MNEQGQWLYCCPSRLSSSIKEARCWPNIRIGPISTLAGVGEAFTLFAAVVGAVVALEINGKG